MKRSGYRNKEAQITIAFCVIIVLFMLPGSFGQYVEGEPGGADDEEVIYMALTNQSRLVGSWNLILNDHEIQYLNLTLSEVDKYLYGPGILAKDNISQRVNAVGWWEGDYYLLYVLTSDGIEMIVIRLMTEGDIISAEYESYRIDGNISTGEVSGSRIVEEIGTQGPTFGASPDEINKSILKDLKEENSHEDVCFYVCENSSDNSGRDEASEKTSDHRI
jgi:hypothetical protein